MAVERRDVEAAVEARRELGPHYDDEIVDSLLAKIDRKLEERRPPARPEQRGMLTPLALGAMFFGVGATAIAVGNGAAWLAAVVWVAIAVMITAVAYFRR